MVDKITLPITQTGVVTKINELVDASVVVDTVLSSSSVNPVQNKVIYEALTAKADKTEIPTNYVTLGTDQNITGTKTFVGSKKIAFKQSSSGDKLGFTLYNNSGTEKGYLEYNPSNTVDSAPLMTLGNYASSSAGITHVGFRKYSSVSGASGAYNLLAPLVADARIPFSLTTTYTNFYLPLGVTNGTNTVVTAKTGVLDISTLLPTVPTATTSSPGIVQPDNDTITINNGVISATGGGATYSAGYGIDITNNTISTDTTIASKTDIGSADITIQRNGTAVGTINANATSASTINISVPTTATDVGALPSSTVIGDGQIIFQKNSTSIATVSANQTSTTTVNFTIPTTASDVGAVPTSRTINGKTLTADVTLTASDVSALPDTTTIGNGATTITVNSTAVGTITANQTTSGSINVSVPTDTTELTNGAGYITAIPTATSSTLGIVQPDNSTITINNGVISASSSSSSRNIGEIVTSTIPLEDAGLHLLDGSQLVGGGIYDDFVTYIGSLYNSSDAQNFIIPTLTENGVLGGHTFAVSASSEYSAAYYAYKAFDGDGATYWATIGTPTLPQTYTIYNPSPLNITNFAITTRNAGECATAGNVYGSYDGINWTLITAFTNSDTAAGSTYDIDLSSNSNYYCYYKLEFTAMSTGTYICCNIDFTATCKNLFVCETAWQNIVTTYGACGKFVYDSINNTVRLPKITGFVEGTTDITALGDLIEAGLPNIIGHYEAGCLNNGNTSYSGAIVSDTSGARGVASATGASTTKGGFNFDASNSNAIYGNSNTVQPQSIKVLYYIVIATSTKTDIQVDIDEIATDLNGKADLDLLNCSNAGNVKMAHSAMPSGKFDDLTLGASGTSYTMKADGYLALRRQASAVGHIITFSDSSNGFISCVYSGAASGHYGGYIPVRKGDTVSVYYTGGTSYYFRFYYAAGSVSEQ